MNLACRCYKFNLLLVRSEIRSPLDFYNGMGIDDPLESDSKILNVSFAKNISDNLQ